MTDTTFTPPAEVDAAIRKAGHAAVDSLAEALGGSPLFMWMPIASITAGALLIYNAASCALPPDKRRKVAFAQLEAIFAANEAAEATKQ